jgi:hypothetical protein
MMIGHNGGMESGVTVKKSELLNELTKNRASHRETFIDAQKGYRVDVIAELDAMLADARSGKEIRRGISLVEPRDHTKDYDRAIRMLEMCTKDEVFISDSEFAQYVMDDWGWKRDFIQSTAQYTGKSR